MCEEFPPNEVADEIAELLAKCVHHWIIPYHPPLVGRCRKCWKYRGFGGWDTSGTFVTHNLDRGRRSGIDRGLLRLVK